MARKSFEGDRGEVLPRRKIEPYRLWFEYLKTALGDPAVTIDHSIYEPWGDVRTADFDDWWATHWRSLFAEPATQVSVVGSSSEAASALADETQVLIRVPLNSLSKVRIAEVEQIVKSELKKRPGLRRSRPKAPFAIRAKRTIRRDVLRGMLRLYQLYLKHGKDLDPAAVEYYTWSTEWNVTVRTKGWDRPLVYVPPQLPEYVRAIEEVSAPASASQRRANRRRSKYDELRPKIRRYVLRAERVARNVGKGVFPGEFA